MIPQLSERGDLEAWSCAGGLCSVCCASMCSTAAAGDTCSLTAAIADRRCRRTSTRHAMRTCMYAHMVVPHEHAYTLALKRSARLASPTEFEKGKVVNSWASCDWTAAPGSHQSDVVAKLSLSLDQPSVEVFALSCSLPPWKTPGLDDALSIASSCLTAFFVVELGVKMFVLRSELFYADGRMCKFNIFDTVIVVLSILDTWIFSVMERSANLFALRLLRVVRIVRALRVVRTLEIFASLRILVSTVVASFLALVESMVILNVVMLMSALFLTQTLYSTLTDDGVHEETRAWVYRYYGTASRAAWTIFEVTFSGGWPTYVRPLVEQVSAGYAIFFYIYISIVVFAMFRIISALFLKDTLTVASMDVEVMIHDKMKEKSIYAQKLLDFFLAADTSGDGMMSLEEFEAILEDERVRTYFSTLELQPHESRQILGLPGAIIRRVLGSTRRRAPSLRGSAKTLARIGLARLGSGREAASLAPLFRAEPSS